MQVLKAEIKPAKSFNLHEYFVTVQFEQLDAESFLAEQGKGLKTDQLEHLMHKALDTLFFEN